MKSTDILDSWKAISEYLGRDIRTCYRWEKELGLPIRRIDDQSSRSKVFAYKTEIDEWLANKAPDRERSRPTLFRIKTAIILISSAVTIILVLFIIRPGFLFWSNSGDEGQFPPAFDEVQSLVDADVGSSLGRENAQKRLTAGSDPIKLYRQGRYYLNKRSRVDNESAIAFFLKTLRIDDQFHLALLGLAQCYLNYVKFGWDVDVDWLEKAESLLKKLGEDSHDVPEYYSSLADVFLLKAKNFDSGTEPLSLDLVVRGISQFPNHPHLNFLRGKHYYLQYGRTGKENDFEKAREFMEKGFWLNPYAFYNLEYSELLMLEESYEEALEICSQIMILDPSQTAHVRMGEILYYMGDLEKSRSMFLRLQIPVALKIQASFYLGMISAQMKKHKEVDNILKDVDLLVHDRHPFRSLRVASMYFGLDKVEEAYTVLRQLADSKAYKQAPFVYQRYIIIDRNFDSYRTDSRFAQILH